MKRVTHIDNAKAIGMMLIIASHVWTTESLNASTAFSVWNAILNSFYVPLFFILSGVFESSSADWNKYLRRLKTIGRYILVFAVFGFISVGLTRGKWSISSCLDGTVIWFLLTLFWISAIFGVIKRLKYNKIIVIALALIGIYLSVGGHSYFYVGQAFLCLPFYATGYYLKSVVKIQSFRVLSGGGYLLVYVLSMCFYKSPQNVSINMVTQNYLTFYLSAFAGSAFVIECSKLIRWDILSWYGRNSIVPMCVQMLFIWIIGRYWIAESMPIYFIEALIAIILSGLCIPLFRNKYYNIF